MLYRFFPHDPGTPPRAEGGSLFVPRALQGPGRHDAPEAYGALYLGRRPVSVIAEFLKRYQRQEVGAEDLWWAPGRPYALAALDDSALPGLLDLDDPQNLVARALRPSEVATGRRKVTQGWARALHAAGSSGFEWWSTIEASWINVTVFAERAAPKLAPAAEPEPLSTDHPAVIEAAEVVGVTLAPERPPGAAGSASRA